MSGAFDEAIRTWVQDAVRDVLRDLPGEVARMIQEAMPGTANAGGPNYLTAEEAAEIAKVRPATVRSWVSRKLLQGHYAGRLLRIRLDELERFMQHERDESTVSEDQDDDARIRELLGR